MAVQYEINQSCVLIGRLIKLLWKLKSPLYISIGKHVTSRTESVGALQWLASCAYSAICRNSRGTAALIARWLSWMGSVWIDLLWLIPESIETALLDSYGYFATESPTVTRICGLFSQEHLVVSEYRLKLLRNSSREYTWSEMYMKLWSKFLGRKQVPGVKVLPGLPGESTSEPTGLPYTKQIGGD